MKHHLIRLLCLALCIALLPLSAMGASSFLIPDSNQRILTAEELWAWDYESLGYILNEIFARHGYVFIHGGHYEAYFSGMPWYSPVYSYNNQACYDALNSVEWTNQQLIKDVRADMRAQNTTNPAGKSLWDVYNAGFDTLTGFSYVSGAAPDQRLPVYAAPSYDAWRGANGKAMVSTNEEVYAAGWDGAWLLIMYQTNNGSVRVGYVNRADMSVRLPVTASLSFANQRAILLADQQLTDDPAMNHSPICTLPSGGPVTYLGSFYNHIAWDYIETTLNGQPVRGFIRSGNLYIEHSPELGY